MKTNELTGPALNWAVRYALDGRKPVDYVEARDNFSTCWNKCGPIIEREEISIVDGNSITVDGLQCWLLMARVQRE